MSPDYAYAPLASVLRDLAPPCNGQDVFMSAELTELEREVCSSICGRCPITDLCDTYATASKVDLGFWARKDRNSNRRRAASSTTDAGAVTPGTHQQKEERS